MQRPRATSRHSQPQLWLSQPRYLGSEYLVQALGCFQRCPWQQGTEAASALGAPWPCLQQLTAKGRRLRSPDQPREQLAVTDRSRGSCLSLLFGGAAARWRAAGWGEEAGPVQQAGKGSSVSQGAGLALKPSIGSWLGQGSPAKPPGEGSCEQGLLPLAGSGCGSGRQCLLALGCPAQRPSAGSPRPSPMQSDHPAPTTARKKCRETPARTGTR